MKIITIVLVAFACSFLAPETRAQDNDTTYVTPAELESGWGLYYTKVDSSYPGEYQTNMPSPKTWELMGFLVSPDGKYLAFTNNSNNTQYYDWFGLKVLNLDTKEIITIDKYGWCPMWTSDSKMLFYQSIPGLNYAKVWFPETNTYDTFCKNAVKCQGGSYLGPDNYFYFLTSSHYPNRDSLLYRTNLDSSLKYGCSYNEPIEGTAGFEWYAPLFPPKDVSYTLRQSWAHSGGSVAGYDLIKNFDAKNGLRKLIQLPDTSWSFNATNTQQWGWGSMVIGPGGTIYAWLSFRPNNVVGWDGRGWDIPPFDSSEILARNASGLYKLDTSGGNLVQLVRSWTYNPGGFDEKNPAVSITADGETIYYGFLQSDTCISIMRMNRFGRNKELVYKIEPITSVKDDPSTGNDKKLQCYYNDRMGELIVKLNQGKFGNSELRIFDYFGRLIEKRSINFSSQNQTETVSISMDGYITGLYFVKLQTGSSVLVSKFLLLK